MRPERDGNNPKQVAFGLMTKGTNTLLATFELSLNGYLWEPAILLRTLLRDSRPLGTSLTMDRALFTLARSTALHRWS